jgi:predicted acylesterase/phospholipase RssA
VSIRSENQEKSFEIVLVLSRGGFRALLFHLVGIRYLHEQQLLQPDIEVYSVSGGSIGAGFLASHWGELTREPTHIAEITKARICLDER